MKTFESLPVLEPDFDLTFGEAELFGEFGFSEKKYYSCSEKYRIFFEFLKFFSYLRIVMYLLYRYSFKNAYGDNVYFLLGGILKIVYESGFLFKHVFRG